MQLNQIYNINIIGYTSTMSQRIYIMISDKSLFDRNVVFVLLVFHAALSWCACVFKTAHLP